MRACCGSRTVRKPSPRRLNPSTVSTIANAGEVHQRRGGVEERLGLVEEATPRRRRWLDADAEERQRRLDEDRRGEHHRRQNDEQRGDVGEHVLEQHEAPAATVGVRRFDVVEGEDLTGRPDRHAGGDGHEPDDDREDRRRVARPELGRHHEGDEDARQRQADVGGPGERPLPARARPGDEQTEQGTDRQRDRRRHHADVQRVAGAEHQLRHDVATELVGPEQIPAAPRGS